MMSSRNAAVYMLTTLVAHASCAPAVVPRPQPGDGSPGAQASADAAEREQRLRPGDVVRLSVWRAPDLTGSYEVDENGIVVFPMLGPWEVTRDSPESLKGRLVEAYSVYFRHPSIDVTLLRRINVLGSVRQTGLYKVDPTMTIADALALAGGATPDGDPNKVKLIRGSEVVVAEVGQDTRIGDLPIRSGDQLFVPQRSWLSRNTNVITAAVSAVVTLIVAFRDDLFGDSGSMRLAPDAR